MAKRIEVVDNVLLATDTITDIIEVSNPSKESWYLVSELNNDLVVLVKNNVILHADTRLSQYSLSNCVDALDVPFTVDTFNQFCIDFLSIENPPKNPNFNEFKLTGGLFDYNDSATQTTPISITGGAGFVDLTNDELGAFTNKTYPPYLVTDIWDAGTNLFDWRELKLGDQVEIRLDAEITTSQNNTEIDIYLFLGIGGSSYTIPFVTELNYKISGTYMINRFNGIYMGDTNTLDNGGKFQIKADKDCELVVNGWYCQVIQRG